MHTVPNATPTVDPARLVAFPHPPAPLRLVAPHHMVEPHTRGVMARMAAQLLQRETPGERGGIAP